MRFDAVIENANAPSCVVLVCEHASNAFPPEFGTLGLSLDAQRAHIAWDIGALALARALAAHLDALLVHAPVSRLIYDLNRAPDHANAMPTQSEVFEIQGNRALDRAARAHRISAVYLPFHDTLRRVLVDKLASGVVPVLVSIHTFTPVFHGQKRELEFGVIHDGCDRLARAIVDHGHGMASALNEPYSAADGATHLLRLHALPYDLPHAMLEIRNDLLSDDAAVAAMVNRLAPAITTAVEAL